MAATTEITDLDDPVFKRRFTSFTDSAWGLRTLQSYSVAREEEAYTRFLDGRFNADHMKPWLEDVVRSAVEWGRDIGRVHIVEHTGDVHEHTGKVRWGDYLRYQFEGYKVAKAAGEDIRLAVVERGQWPKDVSAKGRDLWLFDERTDNPVIIDMHYTGDGDFCYATITEQPTRPVLDRAVRTKRAALCASRPFYP